MVFADKLAINIAKIGTSAISIAPHLPVHTSTAKISSGALRGDSMKFCTCENFPLYGILHMH